MTPLGVIDQIFTIHDNCTATVMKQQGNNCTVQATTARAAVLKGLSARKLRTLLENPGRSCFLVLVKFPLPSIIGAVETDEDVSLAWLCRTLQSCTGGLRTTLDSVLVPFCRRKEA